jgi:acyl dehydratase
MLSGPDASCLAAPQSPTACSPSASHRCLFVPSWAWTGVKNTLNYGADRIRYLAPVPAGSRLRGRITIAAAEDAPRNGLRVTYGVTIEIENRERPACVAELMAVHYR